MKLVICTKFQVNRMNCVESRRGGGSDRPPRALKASCSYVFFEALKALNEKELHEHLRGVGWGVNSTPFYFRHNSQDMILGRYNELHLYFQLHVITWSLIGFHGNQCYINDVTSVRYLGEIPAVRSLETIVMSSITF